jgi:hypothetical protein
VAGALALTASLALTGAAAGEAGRAGTRGEGVVVVDAAGQEVGSVVGAGATVPRVALRLGRRLAVVGVTRDRFFPDMVGLAFESPDCTGPAWIEDFLPDQPGLATRTAIGPGNVLLGAAGPAEERTVRSIWQMFDDPPACDPFPASSSTVLPTTPLLDLDVFVAPFRPEARPRRGPGSGGRGALGPTVVVDATGRRVGSFLGTQGSDGAGVLVDVPGRTVVLTVTGNRFFAQGIVAYSGESCTGAAWLTEPGLVGVSPLFDHTGVAGSTLFAVDGPLQSPELTSFWDNNTATPGCVNLSLGGPVFPAVPVLDLGVFTPPFRPW